MNLPPSIVRTPELDHWIHFNHDGTITVKTGKVEIGQGIKTALAMIAAEELDVDLARIRVETADTENTPNEFITAGSMSVEQSGSAVRVASACARSILLERATIDLQTPLDALTVEDGAITSSLTNEQTDYWSLSAGVFFNESILTTPVLKHPAHYHVVGHHAARVDIPAKVLGEVAFVHDMTLPDMLHGRVVKPTRPGALLVSVPDKNQCPVAHTLVRDGAYLAVLAEHSSHADLAHSWYQRLCRWSADPMTVLPGGIANYLKQNVTRSLPVVDGMPLEQAVPDAAQSPSLKASYYRPFQMHASLGPSAAVAQFLNGKLTVYSHTQSVEFLKLALAEVLKLRQDMVHVIHAEGPGCYGHNGADDVALDASIAALTCSPRPVSIKWSRSDEFGFEPYTPAAVMDLQAHVDQNGHIQQWRHETYSFTHNGRPRPMRGHSNLQTAWTLANPTARVPRQPAIAHEVGIHRNLTPIYRFPDAQLIKHFVADSPLRTSSLRSLGAFANLFAIESFMDELAHYAEQDPIAFRLNHLTDARAIRVLQTLRANAPQKPAGLGRGLGFARYKNQQAYCAILVDLSVSDEAQIKLVQATICADVGLAVDPDGVINQLEGGFIQAASWTLKEAVNWDHDGVTSLGWDTYPILKFSDVPAISTHLIDNRLQPTLGVGEASTGPTPGAIANAVFDAVGLRVRTLPINAGQLRLCAAEQTDQQPG